MNYIDKSVTNQTMLSDRACLSTKFNITSDIESLDWTVQIL